MSIADRYEDYIVPDHPDHDDTPVEEPRRNDRNPKSGTKQSSLSAPEIEVYLLANALADPARLDLLTSDLFATDAALVYDAARRLRDSDRPVDVPLLVTELRSSKASDKAIAAVHQIADGLPTLNAEHWDAHLSTAEDLAYRRHVLADAQSIASEATEGGGLIQPLAERLVQTVNSTSDSALPASWAPKSLVEAISGDHEPELPTVGLVDGTLPLFYAGRVNAINGESGTGKGLVTLAIAAQELAAGHTVAMLDYEDTEGSVVGRLLAMGVDPRAILERFLYIQPNEPLPPAGCAALCRMLIDRGVSLVLIDTVGEAMAMDGIQPNADDEVARWFRMLPRRLAHEGGAAVAVMDHVPKPQQGKFGENLFAIGAQRKRAALDGASYMLTATKSPSRGVDGELKLITAKDRHGARPKGTVAGTVAVSGNAAGDELTITFSAPPELAVTATGKKRRTWYLEAVSKVVEDADEPMSKGAVEKAVGKRREWIRDAMDVLVVEGYIDVDPNGRSHTVTSLRPYRQTDDPASEKYEDPSDVEGANPF